MTSTHQRTSQRPMFANSWSRLVTILPFRLRCSKVGLTAFEQALDVPSRKYEHASLFGRLAMEWLGSAGELPPSDVSSQCKDHLEHVGRKEMYDQRRQWESILFFEGSTSDPTAIKTYLTGIFGSTSKSKKTVKESLEVLRESMRSFKLGIFHTSALQTCMTGMLNAGLLSVRSNKPW